MSPKSSSEPPGKRGRGRPPIHREAWTKVSVVLLNRQTRALDTLLKQIRRKTGAVVTRAELIRALIDALHESRLDITRIVSGIQLKQLIVRKLLN